MVKKDLHAHGVHITICRFDDMVLAQLIVDGRQEFWSSSLNPSVEDVEEIAVFIAERIKTLRCGHDRNLHSGEHFEFKSARFVPGENVDSELSLKFHMKLAELLPTHGLMVGCKRSGVPHEIPKTAFGGLPRMSRPQQTASLPLVHNLWDGIVPSGQ